MKRRLLSILFCLGIALAARAQALAENELSGKWKVTGCQLVTSGLSKAEIDNIMPFKKSFLAARIEFKADKHCSFNIDIPDLNIRDAHWKYNPQTKSWIIQEWKDRNQSGSILMEIEAYRKSGNTFFLITETPFVLQVEKEQ